MSSSECSDRVRGDGVARYRLSGHWPGHCSDKPTRYNPVGHPFASWRTERARCGRAVLVSEANEGSEVAARGAQRAGTSSGGRESPAQALSERRRSEDILRGSRERSSLVIPKIFDFRRQRPRERSERGLERRAARVSRCLAERTNVSEAGLEKRVERAFPGLLDADVGKLVVTKHDLTTERKSL